ncbi:MAG TPA: hypothetical protein VFV95_05790 [Vicinamibacterales bacterium]|nr:hypothetical protein [Vicinamibacterales bacterium]
MTDAEGGTRGIRWALGIVHLALSVVLVLPSPASAWGFEAHKFIMDRAIALLPADLRPIFERHRAVVVERSIDPDTWIIVGKFDEEAPHHFLDIDAYGQYPFRELPRDYAAAVAKFGERRVQRDGTLPWRAQEYFDRLRMAFETMRQRGGVSAELDAIRIAAALCHYVSDAGQPFHGVVNYDGQLTQQQGIHARFETALFQRYSAQLAISPTSIAPVRDMTGAIFDTLIEGTRLVPAILQADRTAAGGRQVYDDAYFTAFFRNARPVLERRLNESIALVAASISGAWR